ncbi:MAG: nucleotidyltransferase domain-containing protein [Candidatus Freyarchaeota archaeon]
MRADVPHPVRKYVDEVAEKFGAKCIILWGSRARGDHTPHSDYDLIVIADFKEKFLDRLAALMELAPPKPNIEALGYTPSEFEKMFQQGNVTALDAIHEGTPLHGEEYFNKYSKQLKKLLNAGLKRTSTWKPPNTQKTKKKNKNRQQQEQGF